MLLEFTYNYGRGRIALDLAAFLPAKKADMNILVSTIQLAADPVAEAEKVHAFISGQVEELQKNKKNEDLVEKLISNNELLVKSFGVPAIESKKEKISFKADTVYRLTGKNGRAEILVNNGFSFKKSGFSFKACKSEKDKKYYVIFSGTGLLVSEGTTRKEAVNKIDEKVISAIAGQPEKIAEYKRSFEAAMIKAGYLDAAEPVQEETPAPAQEVKPEKVEFSTGTVTIDGKTFPADYNITNSGTILAFATIGQRPNGRPEKRLLPAAVNAGKSFYSKDILCWRFL